MPGRVGGISSRQERQPGLRNDLDIAIFTQVTNIRDQVTSSDTLSFTLDNFKPYVQRVTVSQSPFYNSGSPFFIAAWEEYWQPTDWVGIAKLFFNVHQADPIQAASGQYLKIVAVASEPMVDLDKLLFQNQKKSLIFGW